MTSVAEVEPGCPVKPEDDEVVLLSDIHKSFGAQQVLRGVDLRVRKGSVTCLIGPSGSGKTTLLRCVNCLEMPEAGWIWVNGKLINRVHRKGRWQQATEKDLRGHRVETGMVFQQFNLFPHMTALDNITFGMTVVRGVAPETARTEALELLDRVGVRDKAASHPAQLSGGQQQRVAIARSLAMRPAVMLFDEITSALDPEMVGEVLTVVRELAADGMTMILVTHEMDFAHDVADHIVFMDGGKVQEEGTPAEILDAPKTERAQEFLRRIRRR